MRLASYSHQLSKCLLAKHSDSNGMAQGWSRQAIYIYSGSSDIGGNKTKSDRSDPVTWMAGGGGSGALKGIGTTMDTVCVNPCVNHWQRRRDEG